MSQPLAQYRRATPNGGRTRFNPDVDFDFDVPDEGFNIVPNSFFIKGTLVAEQNGGHIGTADIKFDPHAGIHGFFSRFDCTSGSGQINFNRYNRHIAALSEVNQYYQDLFAETDKNMELRIGEEEYTQKVLQGYSNTDYGVPFVFKPLIAFNSSDKPLNFKRMGGMIRISGRLESVRGVLFGDDCSSAATSYYIDNLELHWMIDPAGNADTGPITFVYYHGIRQVINSNNANIQVQMPGLGQAMTATFLPISNEDNYEENTLRTAVLPGVSRVQFSFNDADNSKISFPLENVEEIAWNYHKAMGAGSPTLSHSQLLSRTDLDEPSNRGYGIGISFGQLSNLTSTKFAMNVRSEVSNTDPYATYLFFKAILKM